MNEENMNLTPCFPPFRLGERVLSMSNIPLGGVRTGTIKAINGWPIGWVYDVGMDNGETFGLFEFQLQSIEGLEGENPSN